jgi:hypothetical protein
VANANVADNRQFSFELRINTQTRESLTFQQHVERSLAPPGHPAHLEGYFSLNPEMQAFLVALHEANVRPGNLNDNFDSLQAVIPWATFLAVEGGTIATGMDTYRDAGEALSGYDIYGNPLTPGERVITVAAMFIPGVPASVGRGLLGLVYAKADDALGAAGGSLKSNVGTALNALQKADDDIAKAGAKVDAAADKLDDAERAGSEAATLEAASASLPNHEKIGASGGISALTNEAKNALRASARDIWQARTGRRAIWDGMDVHHRIPLEWSHLFPNADASRAANLIGMKSADHTLVTNAWNAWHKGLNGRTPTQAEVLQQALRIDEQFGNLMTFLP